MVHIARTLRCGKRVRYDNVDLSNKKSITQRLYVRKRHNSKQTQIRQNKNIKLNKKLCQYNITK